MSDLTHPATSAAFEQVRSLVETLQPLGYLQSYESDLFVHDAEMLDRLAVPGARFLYSVYESGTDLMPLGIHPMIDMASETNIDDAIRAEEFEKRTRAQEARLYEFAMTDPFNGRVHYINPDFFTDGNGFSSIMRDRLLESNVGDAFPIRFHNQDWELVRIRETNPISEHLLTRDPHMPQDRRVFEINIDDQYNAIITSIGPKDARYKLNLPRDWEVRQVNPNTPDKVYGDHLVALYQGNEVAHFSITPGREGMVIDGTLTEATREHPQAVPALVEMMVAEAHLQSHSNFLVVNVADMRIDQRPINEVLDTAMRAIQQDRLALSRSPSESAGERLRDPLGLIENAESDVSPTQ